MFPSEKSILDYCNFPSSFYRFHGSWLHHGLEAFSAWRRRKSDLCTFLGKFIRVSFFILFLVFFSAFPFLSADGVDGLFALFGWADF